MSNVIHSDDHIEVIVLDEPGAGGACHKYTVVKKEIDPEKGGQLELGYVNFQKGGIVLHGVNGLTNEALLAIVIHRLECFQAGEFSCRENAIAKTHIETGLLWLLKRTSDRKERGVEGKEVK